MRSGRDRGYPVCELLNVTTRCSGDGQPAWHGCSCPVIFHLTDLMLSSLLPLIVWYRIRKILGIRLWPSQDGKKPWHRNVQDVDGSVLCVSQFTLFGRLSGNKPDYSRAQVPSTARDQYHAVLEALGKAYRPERVRDGVFGAMMDVASVNDGPVTWHLDSKERGAGAASGVSLPG